MADTQMAGLFGAQLLRSGLMAVVTDDCVVVRDSVRQRNTVISLRELSGVKRIRTTYPALLVIAAGFGLIAAAAFYSKQGEASAVPFGLLTVAFALAYVLSRRASVAFVVGSEVTETANGSLSQASQLIREVQAAQRALPALEAWES